MLATGTEIERYVVEGVLGEGGMAVVYRVRHGTLGTAHALKVLTIGAKSVRERLVLEGRVQAALQHPNIVAVTDVIDVDGSPGLLMEYIEGAALDHWLEYYTPTLDEALTVFRAVVAGVGHAHSQELIHRDLKPANVMLHVTSMGLVPKVADFGLAKATGAGDMRRTRTGMTMGTPAYMAPEQVRDSSKVDRRADLYSLGCLLYELVCGRTPYIEEDMLDLFHRIRAGDYDPPRTFAPDLPDAVVDTIDALLTVDPADRLHDCADILDMLQGQGMHRPLAAETVAELGPPRPIRAVELTTLSPDGPAAEAARSMIREIQEVEAPDPEASRIGPRPELPTAPVATTLVSSPPEYRTPPWLGFVAVGAIAVAAFVSSILVVVLLGLLIGTPWASDVPSEPPGARVALEPEPVPVGPRPIAVPRPIRDPVVPKGPASAVDTPPTKPAPAPVVPGPVRPAPVRPVPDAPRVETGSFGFTLDAEGSVTLQADHGAEYGADKPVPVGRYSVRINGTPGAGFVDIRSGQKSTLRCVRAVNRCIPL